MDTLKNEKMHAIKRFKRNQILKNVSLYSFTALACLFYSSPFWFSSISLAMESLCIVYVPKLCRVFFDTKIVFLVGNVIIVSLIIGESKLFSSYACPSNESTYYEEYMNRRQNLRRFSAPKGQQKKENPSIFETKTRVVCEYKAQEAEKQAEKRVVGVAMVVMKRLEGFNGSCDDVILPTEELKKRADDFIARVNKRRVFEANAC